MKYLMSALISIFTGVIGFGQTARINVKVPQLYPEGVAFDSKKNLFYISSVRLGTIGTVDINGNYKSFYTDSTIKSSFGMKIDSAHNRLWVCTGDPNYSKYSDSATFKKIAHVLCFDLATRKKVTDIDLAKLYNGKHFANDLTIDNKGNVYITDSYSPVIYKIDFQGKASVFAQSEMFKAPDVGLNGIVYHPSGFLLTVNNSEGSIYKVDVANAANITKVKTTVFFPGADGLLLDKENNLILIQNKGVDKIFSLSSTDNWQSAEVKAATAQDDRFAYPSTGVLTKGKIYVVNAKLNELADPTKRPSKEFSLQVAELKSVK